jgi:autotransporter-associated beta strand protein
VSIYSSPKKRPQTPSAFACLGTSDSPAFSNSDDIARPFGQTVVRTAPSVTLPGPTGQLIYDATTDVTAWAQPLLAGNGGGVAPTGTATVMYFRGSAAKGTPLSSPPVNAGTYTAMASYPGDANYLAALSNAVTFTISPAPVMLALQANFAQLQAGQELSLVAVATTTLENNGTPLIPPGVVTFYDNGTPLVTEPLTLIDGQDEAVFYTAALPLGGHQITLSYTSGIGNYAMYGTSPALAETVVPAAVASVLTVEYASSDPTVQYSLPWAVAQADASRAPVVINFAAGNGQLFATPQTIVLEAPLDFSGAFPVSIQGPASGVTLVGDYSQSRFPILSIADGTGVSIQGVSIGTQTPGADGDLDVAGALNVGPSVTNLASALTLTGGGAVDLGGQAVTIDSLTLLDCSVTDGTLSSSLQTVFSGSIAANLTGSGALVKEGSGSVVLSGNNTYTGGTLVSAGTLIVDSSDSLPDGSNLTVGANASQVFASLAPKVSPAASAAMPVIATDGAGVSPAHAAGTATPQKALMAATISRQNLAAVGEVMSSTSFTRAVAAARPSGPVPAAIRNLGLNQPRAAGEIKARDLALASGVPSGASAWLWDTGFAQTVNDQVNQKKDVLAAVDTLLTMMTR